MRARVILVGVMVLVLVIGLLRVGQQEPPDPWQAVPGAWDAFDGSSLHADRWATYEGPGNEGVGSRRPSAVAVGSGLLSITGRGDVSGGMAQQFSQTYGRWEVRARMDRGAGYGPAILLWPDSERWPDDGELDIVELPTGDRRRLVSSSHFKAPTGAPGSPDVSEVAGDHQKISHDVLGDFGGWHVYAVEWTADRVVFSVDGREHLVITDPRAIPRSPMHLAIQNDVGAAGHWIGPRDASSPAEVRLQVDWVKVYRPPLGS